jgi:hypothetical protein
VDHAPLTDTIDTADALFQAYRIPRQLEIDHQAATVLEIEALASRIGGQHDAGTATVEAVDGSRALEAIHCAVEHDSVGANPSPKRYERVAILGEDNDRLADAPQDSGEREALRIVCFRECRAFDQGLEYPALFGRLIEPGHAQHLRRRGVCFVQIPVPRKRQLDPSSRGHGTEPFQPGGERSPKRSHARQGALEQHDHCEACVASFGTLPARPDQLDVVVEPPAEDAFGGSAVDMMQMHAPRACDAGLRPILPEHHYGIAPGDSADAAQCLICPDVAAVGRCG